MDPLESRELIARAGQGNREALDQLFERERPRLRRLLALRAGQAVLSKNELEDLVQEAYLEALRQLPQYTYQGRDSFFRWLAAIALHKSANLRRKAEADKRDAKREVRLTPADSQERPYGTIEPPDKGPGPRTLTVGIEEAGRLEAALSQLSPVDKEVIMLARFEGLALAEIAERLQRTPNAVALLLSRALRKLRRLLEPASDSRAEPDPEPDPDPNRSPEPEP